MTSFRTLSQRGGEVHPPDERGSMAILLMVVLVGLMLSALLVPMIITQSRNTRFDSTRLQALNAAQSGIDVTLGAIRASVVSGIGVSSQLPCGPESGTMDSTGVTAYSAVVEYFTFNPVTEPSPSDRAMKCVNGYGTFDAQTGSTTPGFARITSTGTNAAVTDGSSNGRTLTSTYVFRTPDVNILGGLLQLAPTGSAAFCMDAGTPTAPADTTVKVQPCSPSTPPAPQQVFAYRTDLTLQLLSSISAGNPKGLCLNSTHSPALPGDPIRLAQCGPLGSPAVDTQQWSYNDNGQYQAAQSTSATTGALPDLCMNVLARTAGQPVVLGSCSSGWIPSSSVGPGAAALPQWINFSEFGRCLDVTNQDPNHSFLIDYPCKQNPFPGAKTWNELFTAPAIPAGQASVTGVISTGRYCLTSPGNSGGYVTIKACDGLPWQTWTIYGGNKSLNYSTKFTLVSGLLCLGLSGANAELPAWSTIDVETCTGATEQKWNAVPNLLNSTVINTHEN